MTVSYYLHNAKSEYGRTNTIIDKIIARTIQTNSLSMVAAVANMALFAIPSTGTWHVLFQLQLVPLYTISCLVSLNSRADIATDLAGVGPSISMGDITHNGKKADAGLGNGRVNKRNEIPVHVVTMTLVLPLTPSRSSLTPDYDSDSEEFDDYTRKDLENASFHKVCLSLLSPPFSPLCPPLIATIHSASIQSLPPLLDEPARRTGIRAFHFSSWVAFR